MPLGVDNVIQEATGTTSPVTLPSGTTAGNTVVVVRMDNGVTAPTGFTTAASQSSSVSVHYKSDVADAENSWAVSMIAGGRWYAFEVSGLDTVLPVDVTVGQINTPVNGGTAATGTTALDSGLYTMALAAFGVSTPSGSTASLAGWSNGFEEVANTGADATAYGLTVARLFESTTTRTFTTSSTLTTTGAPSVYGLMVVFRAADSPVVAPLHLLLGFEQGTHGGGQVSGAGSMFGGLLAPSAGTWGTGYFIQAASARNSSYGLRIVQAAAACQVLVGTTLPATAAFGMNVRVVSATGTVIIVSMTGCQLLYDATATKFGVRVGAAGTVSWQSGTTALGTWVWVDGRTKVNTSTFHADWRIETGAGTYTDQASAELTGQSPVSNIQFMTLCSSSAQTVTADFDDVVLSAFYGAYPLGPHEVKLLTVDPAGTPTISGTTTNFKVITANGTIGTWDATAARDAIDEVPPTISASADAVAQVTAAATDYMEFPMSTYPLGPTEFINGVRMLAAIGSGTGAGSGDFAIRGYDGTTETALASVSQLAPGSPTAISATAPLWRAAMWQSPNGWTQAELDAAAIRAGFSGDATPDMWMYAVYLEVAIGQTRTRQLFGDFATVEEDPTRLGVMSITVTAPPGGDSTLYYEDNTVPSTVPVPTETSVTQQIDSETSADANYIAFYPPPEGVPDA